MVRGREIAPPQGKLIRVVRSRPTRDGAQTCRVTSVMVSHCVSHGVRGSHGGHGSHGVHGSHGGHGSHGVHGLGPAQRSWSGPSHGRDSPPLRGRSRFIHTPLRSPKRVLDLDVVAPPPRPLKVSGTGGCGGDVAPETRRSLTVTEARGVSRSRSHSMSRSVEAWFQQDMVNRRSNTPY